MQCVVCRTVGLRGQDHLIYQEDNGITEENLRRVIVWCRTVAEDAKDEVGEQPVGASKEGRRVGEHDDSESGLAGGTASGTSL